jgi:hypothetical protein
LFSIVRREGLKTKTVVCRLNAGPTPWSRFRQSALIVALNVSILAAVTLGAI